MFPITWGGVWDYPYPEAQSLIRGMRDMFGADKLVWGSDMPNVERFCTYTQSVDYVRRHCSFLTATEKDAILGGTMATLLRSKRRNNDTSTERNRRTEKRSAFRHRRTNAPTHQAAQATWHPPREPAAPPAPTRSAKKSGLLSPPAQAQEPSCSRQRTCSTRAHYVATRRPCSRPRPCPPGATPPRPSTAARSNAFWKSLELRRPVSTVASPGDYFALTFAGIPTIILRDTVRHAARIRQHLSPPRLGATGRHRQHPRHRLPVSQLDLRTRRHPARRPGMQQDPARFDTARSGLIPLRLDTWGGFLFLCFDADAPDLTTISATCPDRVAAYRLDRDGLRPPQGIPDRVQLETLRRERQGILPHRHRAPADNQQICLARSSGYWAEEPRRIRLHLRPARRSMALLKGDPGSPPTRASPAARGRRHHAPR